MYAFWVGLFVNAEDGGDAGLLQMRGDGFIGREHEFLDQPVGDVARAAVDGSHFAEFIEFDEGSGISKSMAPRRMRCWFKISASSSHQLEALDQSGR